MSSFLSGEALSTAIRDILAEDGFSCAVAFWGRGCETWVRGKRGRVIANLSMGGTNPHALRSVTADLRQLDDLHAKVFIGSRWAVVASANVSANGLGLEGSESSGWLEAGVKLPVSEELTGWFKKTWERAGEITTRDWNDAIATWGKRRAGSKPSLVSFSDFDPDQPDYPLICWVGEGWQVNEEQVKRSLGYFNQSLRARIDNGISLESEADREVLVNRWVLWWTQRERGLPSRRASLGFTQTSDVVVKDGFYTIHDRTNYDVVLEAEKPAPEPFRLAEPGVKDAIFEVLSRKEYALLREEDETPTSPWFTTRLPLMQQFWVDAKACFLSNLEQ